MLRVPYSILTVICTGALVGACSSGSPEAALKDRDATSLLTGESFLLGLGLQSRDESESIDNTPRGGLVIPPSRDLPRPASSNDDALRPADWPLDREVTAIARREERRAASEANGDRPADASLTRDEMRRNPNIAVSQTRLGERNNTESDRIGGWISPDRLRRESAMARELRARRAVTEAPQESLIVPPRDYTTAPEGAVAPEEETRRRWWRPFSR